MRRQLPLVLSATALLVSLLGSTSIGHAAGRALAAAIPPYSKTAGFAKIAGNSSLLNGRKSTLVGAPGTIPVVGTNGKLPASIGAVGPQGDKGDTGSKGDPGLTGVHVVQASQTYPIPSTSSDDATANCASGEVVLGGGGLIQQYSSSGFIGSTGIAGAQPTNTNYLVRGAPVTAPAGGHIVVNAWAVCAKVASASP